MGYAHPYHKKELNNYVIHAWETSFRIGCIILWHEKNSYILFSKKHTPVPRTEHHGQIVKPVQI